MTDLLLKCPVCGGLLDEEDLFCSECGTEAPNQGDKSSRPVQALSTHNFVCQGCGASMSYDARAQTLRCPFCGSEHLQKEKDHNTLQPRWVIPFAMSEARASMALRQWLGKGFWRPGDLAQTAVITKMTPVYVPYWVFSATTFTYWTGDTSAAPVYTRSGWYPVSGEHRGRYENVLVGASSALTPAETQAICPFDLSQAVPPEKVDLRNVTCEQFRVQRKYARPLVRAQIEELERQSCTGYIQGRSRHVKVNVRLQDLTSEPILLPIWIMAYQYKGQLFRFVLNGQTGKSTGQAPTSTAKVAGAIAIAIVILLMFALCAGLLGGAMR
jgi:DNA-directed RNA polymerase subunit RPC12/RpoP